MLDDEAKNNLDSAQVFGTAETLNEESEREETIKGNWREAFRTAFERAQRKQQLAAGREELGRDKSKTLFFLAGAGVALLLLFFGIFSSPKKRAPIPGETAHGRPSLGRKVTPGRENNDLTKTVTPMLSADVRSSDPGLAGSVTPEEVGRTSRSGPVTSPPITNPSAARTNYPQDYALGNVDFSDPLVRQGDAIPPPPPAPASEPPSGRDKSADLKKPSLVFVRAVDAKPAIKAGTARDEE